MNQITCLLLHEKSGLIFLFGEMRHRVKEVQQSDEHLAIVYYVSGSHDPDTNKPVKRTYIIRMETENAENLDT